MRVLLVHYNPAAPGKAGGAESAIRDQRKALELLGHDVIVCYEEPQAAYAEHKPDIVHFHTVHIGLGLGVLRWAQQEKVPHCLSLHDYWPFCGTRMLLKRGNNQGSLLAESCNAVEGICDNKCQGRHTSNSIRALVNRSRLVAFNPYSAAIFKRHGVRIDAVIPHSIDTDFFSPAESLGDGIVTVCAWPKYATKGMQILGPALKQVGAAATIVSGVTRERVRDELRKKAIMVFPSCYQETWGLCLTEAMSSGLACIASDVCGPRAQIEHGENGLLVPPNDVGALADALRSLIDNRSEQERLGRNARAWAESECNLERMGRDYVEFYKAVIANQCES